MHDQVLSSVTATYRCMIDLNGAVIMESLWIIPDPLVSPTLSIVFLLDDLLPT